MTGLNRVHALRLVVCMSQSRWCRVFGRMGWYGMRWQESGLMSNSLISSCFEFGLI